MERMMAKRRKDKHRERGKMYQKMAKEWLGNENIPFAVAINIFITKSSKKNGQ